MLANQKVNVIPKQNIINNLLNNQMQENVLYSIIFYYDIIGGNITSKYNKLTILVANISGILGKFAIAISKLKSKCGDKSQMIYDLITIDVQ